MELRHGSAGKLAAFQVIIEDWHKWVANSPDHFRYRTEAELRVAAEESLQERIAELKSNLGPLRVISTCDCGSIRRGGKWSKKHTVPTDWRTLGSVCNNCLDAKRSLN